MAKHAHAAHAHHHGHPESPMLLHVRALLFSILFPIPGVRAKSSIFPFVCQSSSCFSPVSVQAVIGHFHRYVSFCVEVLKFYVNSYKI